MTEPQEPYADTLRQVLAEHAGQVEPTGRGLARIRARTERRPARPREQRWLRPAAGVASAATLIAVAVLGVHTLGGEDPDTLTPAGTPPASPSVAATSPSPSSATPSPSASMTGHAVPPLVTAWPFPNRRRAAADTEAALAGRPWLADPRETALRFVSDYLGVAHVGQVLDVARPGDAVVVTLGTQSEAATVPVTQVRLLPAVPGSDGPYVVVSATAPDLTITTPEPGARVAPPLRVTGRIVGIEPAVTVTLRTLDRSGPIQRVRAATPVGEPTTTPENYPENGWEATLTVPGSASGPALVVATRPSAYDGRVGQLAAVPVIVSN